MKQWYEELFTNYADTYDKEHFTQGTAAEVDFIEAEIRNDRSKTILDIGCGTGRHAIELASRGYTVTAVDLSESQLARAKEKARLAGAAVTFMQKDARHLDFDDQFEVVIMLCEGAFPLMETDEMNFRILTNAERALKKNGTLIFTTLNVLFPLFHSVKDFLNAQSEAQSQESRVADHTFDLMTFRDYSTFTATDDSGLKKTLKCNERYYAPSEITWLLKSLHFGNIGIFGCDTGNFSRSNKLTPDHFEMLVVAQKQGR